MKKGELKHNASNDRYGIWSNGQWLNSGFHCGECLEILINDIWVPTRMEMDWSEQGNRWYLVGTGFIGNLNEIVARI